MLSIHCRCVTNILKISTKKFDPENNMIDLQGFEHSYIPATPHCGGYTESLAWSQFLVLDLEGIGIVLPMYRKQRC